MKNEKKSMSKIMSFGQHYYRLLDFACGRISYETIMSELKIDSEDKLLLVICCVDLEMPPKKDIYENEIKE